MSKEWNVCYWTFTSGDESAWDYRWIAIEVRYLKIKYYNIWKSRIERKGEGESSIIAGILRELNLRLLVIHYKLHTAREEVDPQVDLNLYWWIKEIVDISSTVISHCIRVVSLFLAHRSSTPIAGQGLRPMDAWYPAIIPSIEETPEAIAATRWPQGLEKVRVTNITKSIFYLTRTFDSINQTAFARWYSYLTQIF